MTREDGQRERKRERERERGQTAKKIARPSMASLCVLFPGRAMVPTENIELCNYRIQHILFLQHFCIIRACRRLDIFSFTSRP